VAIFANPASAGLRSKKRGPLSLFVSQGYYGIDFHRAARGDVAGEQTRRQQGERSEYKRAQIESCLLYTSRCV